MFTSSKDFEIAMYKCLSAVNSGKSYTTLDNEYDLLDLNEAINKASELGYINGIHANRVASGSIYIDVSNPQLTYEGLKFIEKFKL
nr:hypothetical protein [Clostridium paraputrificum]